ncbi:Phytochrome-like protein cph2 [Marinomonas aquimarina]|uniref:Phytochrome-like protein cph2 n=1 Tax=Marinomonas aquimarina TaxID=295068 RepID=A0A1A8TE01_9GAMM|nr:EAL domain-containing protein [Marinomonas aquimarina]SBS31108.1 Phytochrome-like protein cph2 [Marinomonas aquimarina]
MDAIRNMDSRRVPLRRCKILTVEDDIAYQRSLLLSLKTLNYGGREVEFLAANSAQQAATVLAQHPDISLVLLDVVMEQDDSGLRLVRSIRNSLDNQLVRIVLLTGQPGMMPLDDLMALYDVDDYWNKSDLSFEHLQTIVLGNLRTWEHMQAMQQARLGLQMLIESSQRLSNKLDLKGYTQAILEELCKIFSVNQGGIVCIIHQQEESPEKALVFAVSGIYKAWANQYLGNVSKDSELFRVFSQSLSAQGHVIDTPLSALYFTSEEVDQRDYVVLINCDRPLTDYEIDLLQIFGENINAGFSNVALHSRLSELAYFDSITGLQNKNWMLHQLERLTLAERQHAKLLMLFVEDLSYSEVLLGVKFGRSLMKHLASYLKASFVKAIDIVMYERDTLLVLIYDQQDYDRETLEHVLHPQIEMDGAKHHIDLTGALVKLSDMEYQEPQQILGIAKSILEQTKHRNMEFGLFEASELAEIQDRYELMKKLRVALNNEEIFIHLQPKVRLQDRQLVGFEALVRWRDANDRMIPPDHFVPLAETSGLIDKLDEYVAVRACEAVKHLRQAGIEVPISVNIAGSEFSRADFVTRFCECLQQQQVATHSIEIEVTETQLIEVLRSAADYLDKLSALGIRVSIDDFGAGYSSLSYLSLIKAAELKIDRQFIMRMEQTDQDKQIVQMIINLGHLLNMSVIAEGIETESQYQMLLQMGCDAGQGYHIARPMLLEDVLTWSESNQEINI